MIVDGKKYVLTKMRHKNGDVKMFLEPFNEEKYNKMVKEIVDAVKKAVDPEEIVRQGLANLDMEMVNKVHSQILKKAIIKAKKGCYEIQVGTQFIPLVF
jgi:hypothetical protein